MCVCEIERESVCVGVGECQSEEGNKQRVESFIIRGGHPCLLLLFHTHTHTTISKIMTIIIFFQKYTVIVCVAAITFQK